jgi:hypothetical protein
VADEVRSRSQADQIAEPSIDAEQETVTPRVGRRCGTFRRILGRKTQKPVPKREREIKPRQFHPRLNLAYLFLAGKIFNYI